jgi:hypothetical protein
MGRWPRALREREPAATCTGGPSAGPAERARPRPRPPRARTRSQSTDSRQSDDHRPTDPAPECAVFCLFRVERVHTRPGVTPAADVRSRASSNPSRARRRASGPPICRSERSGRSGRLSAHLKPCERSESAHSTRRPCRVLIACGQSPRARTRWAVVWRRRNRSRSRNRAAIRWAVYLGGAVKAAVWIKAPG